jgi:hypothetical protein
MGGFLLFKGGDLLATYQTSKALNQFLEEVQLSKVLALSYRSSIKLDCTSSKEGIHFKRVSYAHPDCTKMALNQTMLIPSLYLDKNLTISINSLGEIEDQQFPIRSKHHSYLAHVKQNQIQATSLTAPKKS